MDFSPFMPNHFLIPFLAVFFLIGLIRFLASGAPGKILRCVRARRWPQARISVYQTDVKAIKHIQMSTWKCEVAYRYTADGATYEGHGINPFYDAMGELDRDEAELLKQALEQEELYCRYHPARPECSILIARIRPRWLGRMWGDLIFMAAPFWFFFFVTALTGDWGKTLDQLIEFSN